MYSFTNEKRLFAWTDMTLRDWIKNNALDYDNFVDMLDDIDEILPDITDAGHVIEAFDSFMITARDSAYIKGVFDCAISCMGTNATAVNIMYRAVISNCYERNFDKYRLLWSEYRKA